MAGGTILVTGAGGTVGREVVRLLVEAGAAVRAGLHGLGDARLVPGADPVALDFRRPATLEAACRGVESIYLLTPQVQEATGYVVATVEAAAKAGVERIVRHSMHDAPNGRDALSRWHREGEALVAASGLRYCILRPNAFMQNFVTIYAPAIREEDFFRLPLGAARLSSVDTRDVAAAAAAVLLGGGEDGAAYVLTGPEALTGAEMAAALSAELGRDIRYVDEPEDAGRPPADPEGVAVSAALVELSAEMREGELAQVSGDVERLTGRPAIPFARFVHDHRAAWV